MLSIFPSLLTFGIFAPFLLRIILGLTILHFGYRNIKEKTNVSVYFGIIELISGLLLIIGLATQVAALVVALILFMFLLQKVSKKAFLSDGVNYYLILFVIAVSLLFLGPGAPAFDLPL